jgi:hypothetical protein
MNAATLKRECKCGSMVQCVGESEAGLALVVAAVASDRDLNRNRRS